MMPGENHSKAAGIASEAAGSCQNCTSLQQSLNEYVAALIGLKQKIIDSDQLLAEYQQKCDDLQDAERENKTLRCQLEQMLQKISPWEQKEQLKSLKLELEEKTSTVDIVPKPQLEIVSVQEECKKCDIVKKKQIAKLKKIQEAASKQIKNITQLKQEKNMIERKLKKIQKTLGDIQNKKCMKNAQTQVTNDQPVVKLDKKKIKILLEELWGCIESSTEPSDGLVLETKLTKEKSFQSPDDCTPNLSHNDPSTLGCTLKTVFESAVVLPSNDSTNRKKSNDIHTYATDYTEDKLLLTETSTKDLSVLQDSNDSYLMNSDCENDTDELLQIKNWAKPLPHLLSPLKLSPITTKYVFGEFTDSSDNEITEGKDDDINGKSKIDCTTLTCIQDQTNIRVAEMEVDENIKTTPIITEVHFGITNNTLTTNSSTEQNPAEKGNTLHSAVNSANRFEEFSIQYPNLSVQSGKLSSNIPKVELINSNYTGTTILEQPACTEDVSEILVIKKLHSSNKDVSNFARCNQPVPHASKKSLSKDSPLDNCNFDEMWSNESESLQLFNITSAGENHVRGNITSARENHVQDSITGAGENYFCDNVPVAGENPVHDKLTVAGENPVCDNLTAAGEKCVCDNLTGAVENGVCNNVTGARENPVCVNLTGAGENPVCVNLTGAGENPVCVNLTSAGENPVCDKSAGAGENSVCHNVTSSGENPVCHNVTGENPVCDNVTVARINPVCANLTGDRENPVCDNSAGAGENPVCHNVTGESPVCDNVTVARKNPVCDNLTSARENPVCNNLTCAGENPVCDNVTVAGENPVCDNAIVAEENPVCNQVTFGEENPVCDNVNVAGKNPVCNNVTVAGENPVCNNVTLGGENPVCDNVTLGGENPVCDNVTLAGENPVCHNVTIAGENPVCHNVTVAGENPVCHNVTAAVENPVCHNVTVAVENPVCHNVTVAGENPVCGNEEKDVDDYSLTNKEKKDNLLLSTQPNLCLNEFIVQSNNDSKNLKGSKPSKSCFEGVDTGKPDNSTSGSVEMSFAAKTLQLSQSEVEEKCGNSSSTLVQCEHNNELGTQDSLEFRPASTEHQFQRDSADAKTAFNLECYTAEKENNLSQPFADRYNLGFSMKKLEDESKQTMHLDLQTCAIQIDKVKESKQHAEEAGSTSKCHNKNEQGKMNPPEIFQFCSFNANPYTFVSSKAQTAVVSDVQPVTDTQLDKCSEKQTVDDQLCSARHEQSHATNLLQVKNKFPSNFDTTNADGCLGKLEQKHTSLLSKQQLLKTSEELVTVSRDHFITINKNICKGVTPKEEFCAELDSALGKTNNFFTLQSGNDTPPLKSNEMPFFSLENQQQLKLLLESSKALNKITGETNGNGDPCGPSLDSSEEDNIVIRKVSYTKVLPSNPVILKNQCKSASERLEDVCNVRLGLNDTPFKYVVTKLTETECAGDLSASVSENIKVSSKTENSILMEHYPSVDKIVNTEDGRNHTKNTVEQYSCNREMTTLEGNNKQKEKLVSENIQYDSNNTRQNCIEYEAKKTLPGKNLIWNFERPDDSTDPRVISGKHKLQANEKMLNGNSGNSFLGSFNIEKRTKLNRPHKVKYIDFVSQAITEESRQQKLSQGVQNIPVVETVLANADTSTNLDHSPETISKVRTEMGPPLPPLLGPLLSTPPKSIQPLSPLLSSLPSPLDELISPLPGSPFPQLVSPLSDRSRQKSPVLTTPPAEKANRRILSSPLQFCAATPKHALPVPGRLPLSASSSSSTSVQENSVKILDTMYPELSARARTLNILKGNVQLNQSLPRDGKNVPVSQITGFKPITSTSTAFIKTGGNSKADSSIDKSNAFKSHQQSSIGSPSIRTSDAFLMPRSAKRLRLDTESPVLETMKNCSTAFSRSDTEMQKCKEPCRTIGELQSDVAKDNSIDKDIITKALKKIEDLCFDLLPVIRSHIFVGTIPKVPVMRNEEKEVIYEFSNSKKSLADRFLQVVLQKIKTGKRSMATAYLQAHCRVYVGLCRQLGDIERARVLCYSILKEDFPDPDRLLLFIVSSWNDIISTHGVISKAIQAVLKNLAREDVASCLSAYLNWEKTPPMNVTVLLSSVLMAVQLCPDGKFQQSKKFGEDLTDSIWEYVFAVDLLCSHRKWLWTHDNIISKELWPLLDKWVKRKKGNPNVSFVPDIVFATVIRLVGHLCQMGLKEGFITAVKNICAVITAFLQHANEEGMPWGVQLACVYMLFDLAPSDPAAIYKTLQAWKESAKNDIPPAVAICMQELESMCGFRK